MENKFVAVLKLNPYTPPVQAGNSMQFTFVQPDTKRVKSVYIGKSVMRIENDTLLVADWLLKPNREGIGVALNQNWAPQNGEFIKAEVEQITLPAVELDEKPLPAVPKGYYSVRIPEDSQQRTFRVKVRNGRGFVYLKSSHDFLAIGNLYGTKIRFWQKAYNQGVAIDFPIGKDLIEKNFAEVVADLDGTGLAYSRESNRCFNCNKMLTDITSIDAGLGPECRSRRGL